MKEFSWDKSQVIATIAAPFVLLTMWPVYRFTGQWWGDEWGWYAGFLVYWPVWGVVFPLSMLGWKRCTALFWRRKMTSLAWTLVALPPVMALIGKHMGMEESDQLLLLWIPMTLINGALEELLWRGVFTALFPRSVFWGILWPTLWFALWHFAPGMLSMGERVWILVTGAAVLGLVFGYVVHSTGSIRWTTLSHILAGIVQG